LIDRRSAFSVRVVGDVLQDRQGGVAVGKGPVLAGEGLEVVWTASSFGSGAHDASPEVTTFVLSCPAISGRGLMDQAAVAGAERVCLSLSRRLPPDGHISCRSVTAPRRPLPTG